jgi:hypothetical protein
VTAANVICSPKHGCILIAADTAAYSEAGIVTGFCSKVSPIPQWSCAVTGRGMVGAQEAVVQTALEAFSGFSDMVAGIGDKLPHIVKRNRLKNPFELILAGFSTKRGEPQSWFIQTPGSPAGPGYPPPYQIRRMPNVAIGPVPTVAGYETISENDEPETIANWLGKVLELQRHSLFDGMHWIGGRGELTTITPRGIEQRGLRSWPEDRIGALIKPAA